MQFDDFDSVEDYLSDILDGMPPADAIEFIGLCIEVLEQGSPTLH